MIKKLSAPIAFAMLGGTLLFAVACGDDEAPPVNNNGKGGSATGGGAGAMTGGTAGTAGTAGASTGGTPTGGTGGTPMTGGTGGTPMTGGAAGGGAGGAGGATGGGAGGAAGGGAGGAGGAGMMCLSPLPMGGMGGMAGGAGGAPAGAGGAPAGAGGAPAGAGGMAAGAGGMAAGAGGGAMTGPRVIATFDTPGSLNMAGIGNWGPGGNPPIADTVVSRNATEGFSCAGAAELRVPFTAYGTQQDVQINFNPLQNWTGYTILHAKVKIVMPSTGNLNHINGVQLAANSKPDYSTFQGHFYGASTFADFGWHDVDLPMPGMGAMPLALDQVIQITVQLVTPMTAPAAGPAAPVTTTMLVDDVWIQ